MKKPKPLVTKTVLGLITTSILASSCSSNYNLDDNKYGDHAENFTLGDNLVDVIEAELSDEILNRSQKLAAIVEDMFNNRELARQFAQNPNGFLLTRGYTPIDEELILTENEKIFLLALSDDEIMAAAEAGDINSFIRLTHEKGYLGMVKTNASSLDDLKALFKSEAEYNQFMDQIKSDPNYEQLMRCAWVWVAVAVVYAVVGGIQYAVAETIAAVQLGVIYHVGAYWKVGGPSEVVYRRLDNLEPALRLYMDFEENRLFYDDLHKELVVNQTETIMNVISDQSEKQLTVVEIENAKKIISTNLEGYYGFRK